MKVLITGAGALLAAIASPALANGGGGHGGGAGPDVHSDAGSSQSFERLATLLKGLWMSENLPAFSSPGKHSGWFQGHHWGWFKQHNPHWPHDNPASP